MALAAACIASGCGGGGTGDTTAGQGEESTNPSSAVEAKEGLTKAQLIAKGDAICEEADKEQEVALKAYLKKHPKAASNPKEQTKMVEVAGLPPIRTEVEKLAELGAPPGEEDEVGAILAEIEKALGEGEKDPSSLVGETNNPFEGIGQKASKYGFNACSNAL